MRVVIFEAAERVLRKVKLSGGGRCNLTNTFANVTDLSQVYPRGHRLMRRLFHVFGPEDTCRWFEQHGVTLMVQEDGCVFPRSQQSQSIVDCLQGHARRLGIEVVTGRRIGSREELHDFDFVCVTTGGGNPPQGIDLEILPQCPSLFTFSIANEALRELMGTVVEGVSVQLTGSTFRTTGPLLITHWGMSGPSILRLSSYAARYLYEHQYHATLSVNWLGMKEEEVRKLLLAALPTYCQRLLFTVNPFSLPSRLWQYLIQKTGLSKRWGELSAKDINRLCNVLVNDLYPIAGRAPFKDEFVTCGGVPLSSLQSNTLQSRVDSTLYFAGEVLDIDGVTGGFNFQCAWTTAFVVAQSIAKAAAP